MKLFRRLHGRLSPQGLETRILRQLPRIALVGSLLAGSLSVLVRILPPEAGVDRAKHILSVDIFAISVAVTFLTAVFTVAIGCIVVHIMKGPAYLADSYPVEHADRPKPPQSPGND
jgi:hypothetical protein